MIALTLLSIGLAAPPEPTSGLYPSDCPELLIDAGITFRPGSARVRRSEKAQLTTLAEQLNAAPAPILLLSVEGYQSAAERREGLALARAKAVQDALLELGVHPARLVPLGHDLPLYWRGSKEALGEHRVEFHVLLENTCDSSAPK